MIVKSSYGTSYNTPAKTVISQPKIVTNNSAPSKVSNLSQSVNNIKNTATNTISAIGNSLSSVKNNVVNIAAQTKTQVNKVIAPVTNTISPIKEKVSQSVATISNNIASSISASGGKSINLGIVDISVSASVSQKVGKDNYGTIDTNVNVSGGKTEINVSHQNDRTKTTISKNEIQSGTNGFTIPLANNKYYSSELTLGGTSVNTKSAEATLFEHTIATKPASNNLASEIKTSVSVNTDNLKKVAMVAAGVALVAGAAYLTYQSGGLAAVATAPAMARGLTLVQTAFAR